MKKFKKLITRLILGRSIIRRIRTNRKLRHQYKHAVANKTMRISIKRQGVTISARVHHFSDLLSIQHILKVARENYRAIKRLRATRKWILA